MAMAEELMLKRGEEIPGYSSFETDCKRQDLQNRVETQRDGDVEDDTVLSPALATETSSVFQWLTHPFQTLISPSSESYDKNIISSGFSEADEDGKSLDPKRIHRFIDRDADFHQSKGKMAMRKRIRQEDWQRLYGYDVFHALVSAPTLTSVSILLFFYFLMVLVFAFIFYAIAMTYDCNLGVSNFEEAYMLSLETMATIGYDTKDIFFDDCILPMVFLTIQLLVRIFADAVVIGVIYARLARPTTRASTILFTKNAVIRRVRGKLYFMFQLCELRKHQLVEAHVRLYVLKKNTSRGGGVFFQLGHMRLNHPNDDLGGMLLMALPQVVVHELDASSPLMPPPRWLQSSSTAEGSAPRTHVWRPPAYEFAANDTSSSSNTTAYDKHIMSEMAFPNVSVRNPDLLFKGSKTTSTTHTHSAHNGSAALEHYGHLFDLKEEEEMTDSSEAETVQQQGERQMIQSYMQDRAMEVLVIVEGVDSATGGNVQCRHSYVCDEVVWNHMFKPCVYEGAERGVPVIDFSVFHALLRVGTDAAWAGAVPSTI